ncbi:MAG: class I SAM-dependent methyltransferase [Nitrospirae bacterium]|nr:MAG: class I SAM-dependent methyltransferase [Nitrospirota bacterium]
MTVFNKYALYYDLLYKDKDYAGEAVYVHNLIQQRCSGARSILNIGCGSGRHDREFVKLGYKVTGVDFSDDMLAAARQGSSECDALEYHNGDIRTVRLGEKYDVVVSLFHAIGYQVTNNDLKAAFTTAHSHLNSGGIFIFDFWYGPAVLTDSPKIRIKEMKDELYAITRIAQPTLHVNKNVVDVCFRIFARDLVKGTLSEFEENHSVRYLFLPEIALLCDQTNFSLANQFEWLSQNEPSTASWYVSVICRAN